ncbi:MULTISPECIES: DNA polymerase III subunit [Sanguibacteroides]|uniref:DNA polymerase III subunit delta n=1 Tax=Sanguibacteroides justesenii TaxID=1547597 RepID=A0A0C3RDG9_9PORP|nr:MULTISPECIES: DNA polymerase III subunit delta [Sanguibacteroides]KIO44291.1 DNA polymerase III subunit delta [Sanguibacteroides justesenii]KIO45492.1 DNA polymerase III subunit delta [Sanguibacteroides justesenii]
MFFKEVIGHEEIKQRLLATLQSGRVSHAQLFTGETGSGSLALALAFTQYLFCTGDKHEEACGVCPACKKMQKLIHPDLHFVFPVVKSTKIKLPVSDEYLNEWRNVLLNNSYIDLENWLSAMGADENAQAMIYTEESGNILRKLALKPFESDYKVMIIWLPEKMKPECSNKLLKILEEPYPRTLFLLVSEHPEEIINTILSRTQRVHIPPLGQEEIAKQLIRQQSLSPDSANEVAHVASGSWLKALKILEETEESVYNQEKFIQMMRLCWERKMLTVNEFVNELAALGRERQKSFLTHCIRMIRENFVRNFELENIVYMTKREKDFSVKFSPYVHEGNVIPLYEEFERAYSDIIRNGNGKIIFTDLCIKVMQNIRP